MSLKKKKNNNNLKLNISENFNFFNFIFPIWSATNPTLVQKVSKQLLDFYHIWSPFQWISSLLGLVLLYLVTGYFYNKWLSEKGGWLDMETRIWLIVFDITLNLVLGIYYMNHRETMMGSIMVRCPVAISPGIFALELVCFYFYCRYVYRYHPHSKSKKNKSGNKSRWY